MTEHDFCEIQRRFDEIIAELPAYGHTLAKIKASYETVMAKIESSKRVSSVVKLEDSQRRLQEKTLSNFLLYQQQLEAELTQLRIDNDTLKKSIENHREMQSKLELRTQQELETSRGKTSMNSERRKKLNLTVEQATDVFFLDQELKRVEQELEDIKIGTEKRHVPFSKKTKLQVQLQDKEKEKIKLERENKYLGCLFFQLSVALKSAASVYSSHRTKGQVRCTMVEEILNTINGIDDGEIQRVVEEMNEEDKDDEKEAEFILYCTERFHELFDSEQYEEAALLVATSPMGFLRTLDTLEKFKAVSVSTSDQAHNDKPIQTPLFVYCTTLMHSASLFNPLSLRESFEFVRCALECRQYVRIMNWIASGNLPISKDMAMIVFQSCSCAMSTRCVCHCCEIALLMFESLGQHNEVASCLAKLGMHNKLLKFIKDKRLPRNDVASLLYFHPNVELAISLTCPFPPDLPQCHILEVVFILSQLKQYSICTNVLKDFSCRHSVSMREVLDDASKNPAYQELVEQLIDLLGGTELDWMAIELVANRVVRKAINNAFDEIQETCMKSNMHSSTQTSCTLYEETSERLSEVTGSDHGTPLETLSRPRLVRSSHIDLSDSDDVAASDISSTIDDTSSGSYLSEL